MKPSALFRPRCGWIPLILVLLVNRWTTGWMFGIGGLFPSVLARTLIDLLDLLLIGAGVLWLMPAGEPAGRGPRNRRSWILSPVAGILATGVVFLLLETIGLLGLAVMDGPRPGETLGRHVLLGSPPRLPADDAHVSPLISFHPLYGWFVRDTNQSVDRYGFQLNHPADETALEEEADLRIFVLGGSTVAGAGTYPSASISAYLERMLQRRWNLEANVVNAGVGGWASTNQLAFLMHNLVPFFNPDALIVVDGFNDVKRSLSAARKFDKDPGTGLTRSADGYLYDAKIKRYQTQFRALREDPIYVLNQLLYALGVRRFFLPDHYFTGAFLGALVREEPDLHRTVRHTRKLLRESRDQPKQPPLSPERFQTILAQRRCRTPGVNVRPYLQNVRSTVGLAADRDLPVVYALQPTLFGKNHRTHYERKNYQKRVLSAYASGDVFPRFGLPRRTCLDRIFRTFFGRARGLFQSPPRRLEERQNVRMVDLSRLFEDRRRTLFIPKDIVHYNPRGNELIAERLFEQLTRMKPALLDRNPDEPSAQEDAR